MAKHKDITAEELVFDNTEDGKAGIGENYFPKLDAAYVAKDYYDYVILKTEDMPSYYDISAVVARSYDALKVGGNLYIDTNGTAFDLDRFKTISELFFD